MTQPDPQPVEHVEPVEPVRSPGFGKRNVAMTGVMVLLMLLLALGQWLQIQAGQHVAAALAGTTRTGPVDMEYKGMAFSREHVLVARYQVSGIQDVTAARWHAKPWGYVALEP